MATRVMIYQVDVYPKFATKFIPMLCPKIWAMEKEME